MGQKVIPIGLRLGINRSANSKWYADKKSYAKVLAEDLKIREFLNKKVSQAGVSNILIERSADKVSVTLVIARPGLVIGKKGSGIDKLRQQLSNLVSSDIKLNIVDLKKSDLDANIVAGNIAKRLEKRVSYRKAMKDAIFQAMASGAQGIRVNCSGRLAGADIARMEWYREGRVPLHTFRADIDYGVATAHTTYGACGIKVWIYKGDIYKTKKVDVEKDLEGVVNNAKS